MATLGYVRSSNGPDLAQVGANQQIVSHIVPNTTDRTIRITHISAWGGNWGGQATIRFGIWAATSSSAAPGALLARTQEVSPSVSYVDGAGGQLLTAYLEMPIDIAPGQVICLGVASRGSAAGIAMFEAQDISQPNENFYRKSISGTTMQTASGSAVSNEGQLAISATGTTNVRPDQPDQLSPVGDIATVSPTLRFRHRDPDGDRAVRARVQVQTAAGVSMWDEEVPISVSSGSYANISHDGAPLLYHTEYRFRVHTWDPGGENSIWSEFAYFTPRHTNRAPNLPSDGTGIGTINGTLATTVSFAFTDPDWPYLPNGQVYERFDAKQVRLRRVADNVLVYNPGIQTATQSERDNRRSSTAITLPAYDTLYQWEERHRDRSGAWSEWRDTPTQIIARSGGAMGVPSSPAGRITNPNNPGIVTAVYVNSSAINATTIQFVLTTGTGAGVAVATFSGVNVAPGTAFTRTWAEAFPGVVLGEGLVYSIRARAIVSGSWTDFSGSAGMTVNARPSTPTLYGPVNGQARSSIPTTSVRVTDPDQPNTQLTVSAELYNADTNALIGTYNLPYLPGSGESLRNVHGGTPASLISGYGNFKWRAKANDGYLDSAWSPLWSFTYAAVPSVSVTSPAAGTITTSQPTVTWSSTGQTHWRVVLRDASNTVVYDTGQQTGAAQQHVIGTQYWIGGERWNNHESFALTVMVRDASTLWGDSNAVILTLEYIAPSSPIVNGTAQAFPGVKGTHYGVLDWTQTEYLEDAFLHYAVDRIEIDGPNGNVDPRTYIEEFARIGDSAVTTLTDFDMTSSQWYRWGVRQVIQAGVDVIASAPVYVELMVSWHGTLLHMPFDPLNNVVWLQYGGNEYRPRRERVALASGSAQPSGYRAPIGYTGSARQTNPSGDYTFIANDAIDHIQQLDMLDQMYEYQFADFSPDGRPHIICWREGRGGRKGRLYVFLSGWEDSPSVGLTTQAVTLQFEERHYALSVAAGGSQ